MRTTTASMAASANRRQTSKFLVGSLLLAAGTPALLGLMRPDDAFYLLQPMILMIQAVPYVMAACLWLPWRSPDASAVGRTLSRILFVLALAVYLPTLTPLWSTGGDMVGLGYMLLAMGTVVCVLLLTAIGFGRLWMR